MRIATLDLGTNTFLLLVAERTNSGIRPLFQAEEIIRLGAGVDQTGRISPQAMDRGVACLQRYLSKVSEFGAETIVACGTSALRDAHNRADFLARVREATGLQIHILSGEQEAEYAYFGALSNKQHLPAPIILIDVGGGSTEICQGDAGTLRQRLSLQIGSVRLTEKFLRHDPVTAAEIAAARAAIRDSLRRHFGATRPRAASFVGVAGTVTTLAAMHLGLETYDAALIENCRLSRDDIQMQIERMAALSIEERGRLAGLAPKRADVELGGALIVDEIMDALAAESMVVSDRGLRFGIALAHRLPRQE